MELEVAVKRHALTAMFASTGRKKSDGKSRCTHVHTFDMRPFLCLCRARDVTHIGTATVCTKRAVSFPNNSTHALDSAGA